MKLFICASSGVQGWFPRAPKPAFAPPQGGGGGGGCRLAGAPARKPWRGLLFLLLRSCSSSSSCSSPQRGNSGHSPCPARGRGGAAGPAEGKPLPSATTSALHPRVETRSCAAIALLAGPGRRRRRRHGLTVTREIRSLDPTPWAPAPNQIRERVRGAGRGAEGRMCASA